MFMDVRCSHPSFTAGEAHSMPDGLGLLKACHQSLGWYLELHSLQRKYPICRAMLSRIFLVILMQNDSNFTTTSDNSVAIQAKSQAL